MKLARNNKVGMDFEFQHKFFDISSEYKEVNEEDPRLLCQASWATTRYINDHLPENIVWDNEDGILIDTSSNEYDGYEKAEYHGDEYAICPEAYEKLDELLPAAVEYGLKETFGHAKKYRRGKQMARGIIYVMTTVVPGLIKIGKTGTSNFEQRMYNLEKNGYSNVVGLKRCFAIEVEDYDEKERLIDEIFSKSRVENTELFAIDVNLAMRLLSSFEGKQVFPTDQSKEEVFVTATANSDIALIPEGTYFFERKIKAWNGNTVTGTMEVKKGHFIVKKGSVICPIEGKGHLGWIQKLRNNLKIDNNVLQEDVELTSPSAAGVLLIGAACNGWSNWKDATGKSLDYYRNKASK